MRQPVSTLLLALASLSLFLPGSARAADAEPILKAIADFMLVQNKGLPGKASYELGHINVGGLAAGCRNIAVKMDAGARPWGRTNVNVRCTDGAKWSLYVPVRIHVAVDYLVSARPLRAGQLIMAEDLSSHPGDLAELPAGVLTDPAQALGLASRISMPANRPLRADMLRKPLIVKQGQSVKLISAGAGFTVANEGSALNNATAGQVVRVRLASGFIVSGVAADDGTIEIAH